jgi:hypothetical protein
MNYQNLKFNKGLIIDTNLLVLLIVGYFDKNYIKQFKRTSTYSIDDFENLKIIVNKFESLITTPHILAEISNLCIDSRNMENKSNKKFKEFLKTFINTIYHFKEINLEKNKILILDFLKYLGVTDSALIEIAKKHKFNVITDDAGVYVKLSSFNVPVININHLRAL